MANSKQNTPNLSQEELTAKAYALLGFAQKAGKVISGDEGVCLALQGNKKVQLIIVATDLSENSKKKFQQHLKSVVAAKGRVPACLHLGDKQSIGLAIGKSPRGLIAVLDINFAKGLSAYLQALEVNKGVV